MCVCVGVSLTIGPFVIVEEIYSPPTNIDLFIISKPYIVVCVFNLSIARGEFYFFLFHFFSFDFDPKQNDNNNINNNNNEKHWRKKNIIGFIHSFGFFSSFKWWWWWRSRQPNIVYIILHIDCCNKFLYSLPTSLLYTPILFHPFIHNYLTIYLSIYKWKMNILPPLLMSKCWIILLPPSPPPVATTTNFYIHTKFFLDDDLIF